MNLKSIVRVGALLVAAALIVTLVAAPRPGAGGHPEGG